MHICAAAVALLLALRVPAGSPRIPLRPRRGVCEFPSIYRDKIIRQCQRDSRGLWWCPKDDNYDLYHQRAPCPNTSVTYGGSDPGHKCHFPFVYNRKQHSTCLRATEEADGSTYWWCATSGDYDADRHKRWTRCKEQSDLLPCVFSQRGGTGIKAECRDFNDQWVCHTELSEVRECPRTATTYAGNSPGDPCHFPFLFGKVEYRSCISARRSGAPTYGEEGLFETYLWCSTTANYNRDARWTKCVSEDVAFSWRDRRFVIPVSVVFVMLTVTLCLSATLHFCCEGRRPRKEDVCSRGPSLHISLREVEDSVTPTAPPSYLEAVRALNNYP